MLANDTIIGTDESEEINHYGVLGMKWGVHRARQTLSDPNASHRKKVRATTSLMRHRGKSQDKIAKLEKQKRGISAESFKNAYKAERTYNKAVKLRREAKDASVSDRKARRLERKVDKLDTKSARLRSQSARIEARLEKNMRTQLVFKMGISEIDKTLTEKGRKYIVAAAARL